MKKFVLALAATLAFAACAFADQPELPAVGQPVLLTPFGQSQDGNAVKLMTKKFNVEYEMACFADRVDWSKYKSLVYVLGGSGKGLGAAGLDIPSELKRCQELVAAAKEQMKQVLTEFVKEFDEEHKTCGISVSAGICVADKPGIGFKELYEQADMALYTSKRAGKARYTVKELS